MLGQDEIDKVAGREMYGSDGERIGTARQVYTDDQTGEPAWATVRTGLLAHKESFVPLSDAEMSGDRLTVPYTKDYVKDAPNIDEEGHLTPDQEQELYAYYGRTDDNDRGRYAAGRTGRGDFEAEQTGRGDFEAEQTGRGNYKAEQTGRGKYDTRNRDTDTSSEDYAPDRSEGAMTVSEERVNVGKQRHESGRARLRKYVVTDHVTQTVPVQREEARLEREPITEANRDAAYAGPDISEDDYEVVLHEEQPVVEKETVPTERVRLHTETVTDHQRVDEEVRRERVDVEGDSTRGYN
jgi:uncharacterized protein (TIGR02271 family)